jgi:enoyl-CoA hydratase
MSYETLILEKNEGIAVLKINRPKALNALNTALLSELDDAVATIEKDDEIKVLIITGEGKAFVAGADITEMKDKTPEEARTFAGLAMGIFRRIELMEKPIIAAVNGFALGGGCEISMACDIRIASEKAKFGQPEVGLGITPGFAGTQRLPRLIGIAKAKELIYTARMVDAAEALQLGLVNSVAAPEALMDEAVAMAKMIAKNSQSAVRYAKTAINRGIETDIETGMLIEKDVFGLCFANEEQKEGMTAFVEKRKPNFK